MYAIEKHYYRINRILLLIIGIWPCHSSMFAGTQRIIVTCVLGSGLLIQLIALVTRDVNSALVIDVLSYVIPSSAAVLKYYYFYIKREIMKRMVECVQTDWNSLKDEHEREIIESYAEEGRVITGVITLFSCSGLLMYVTLPIPPYVVNICLSRNNTYSHYVYIPIDYSVNQEKYMYVILLHFVVFFAIGLMTVVGIGTFLGLFMKHACGLLKIASYRIEHAMDVEKVKQICPIEREYIMCVKIMRAVEIQQKALKFANYVISSFTIMYFILITMGAVSVSVCMFRLLRVLQTNLDIRETLVIVGILIGHFLYMFLGNYLAQEVTDHCNNLFHSAYSSMWYIAPLRVQKLILFLLQHGTKNFTITHYGIFVVSVEGFATMASTSLSYFMMLYSTQTIENETKK